MDKILIKALECMAHIGVPAAERRRKQRILLDLVLELDLKKAGRQDRVEATLDYAAVTAEVQRIVRQKSFRLVEALAEQTAEMILKKFQPDSVTVRVRKFSVPGARSVGVEIVRPSTLRQAQGERGSGRTGRVRRK